LSIAGRGLCGSAKKLEIVWNSNAFSTIEMIFKRQGQKKAVYYYGSSTNGGQISNWISIGSILENNLSQAGLPMSLKKMPD